MSENIKEKANYTREDLEKAILSVKSGKNNSEFLLSLCPFIKF